MRGGGGSRGHLRLEAAATYCFDGEPGEFVGERSDFADDDDGGGTEAGVLGFEGDLADGGDELTMLGSRGRLNDGGGSGGRKATGLEAAGDRLQILHTHVNAERG